LATLGIAIAALVISLQNSDKIAAAKECYGKHTDNEFPAQRERSY
jgi:hypothetical protein